MATDRTTLAVVGFGNMGGAIIRGALAAGVLPEAEICVAEPDDARRGEAEDLGLRVFADPSEAIAKTSPKYVMLAIKPQMLAGFAQSVLPRAGFGGRVVISILAGVTIARIAETLRGPAVVRVMPNLPASVGMGATAIAAGGGGASVEEVGFAKRLFGAVSSLVVDLPEDRMDVFTAVAGSGPAYLFLLAETMTRAAVELGLPEKDAAAVVRGTLVGAAEMMARDKRDAGVLRAAVTSRGGTTAAALGVFEQRGMQEIVTAAVKSARDRGAELAGG